ncbi:sulfur carrier protein ThiS [Sandaracinobacteroides saxicola]|uniref:Sulfur carrier protein ThiS n=1 Tax=Sandaracinobacteroides saxicola TaxID=2759707 RepID=A0A7G5IFT4_9SPHN|nr:sulfur carrier protein ThiS [Sandaracinobacteroides saxicola]
MVGLMLSLTLNGAPHAVPAGTTVAALVASLALGEGRVAVERNREIASRSRWEETLLADGDVLEIVHFVGGG